MRSQIPHDGMVDRTVANQSLATLHHGLCKSLRVLDHLRRVRFELWSGHFFQLNGEGSDRNIVWATLQHRKDGKINGIHVLLPGKDYP